MSKNTYIGGAVCREFESGVVVGWKISEYKPVDDNEASHV